MLEQIAKQIHSAVLDANKILLIPHKNPDGDTLGSVTAFMQWLKNSEKSYLTYCSTPISPSLRYLPHIHEIGQNPNVFEDPTIDLIIVFDSGDLRYAGVADLIATYTPKVRLVNIDHHATNEQYGTYNLVTTTAASTTEILYRFFTYNKITPDTIMATCLLTGLLTDTGHFTNAATSKEALAIGSRLLSHGGNFHQITTHVLKDQSVQSLQLWGLVLSRLAKEENKNVVYTYLLQKDLQKYNMPSGDIEGIANFLNSLDEGNASLVLKEQPDGMIKGSFRTTKSDIDVSAYAQSLGGGGHKKAAGFTVEGPIEEAKKKIFAVLNKKN